MIKFNKNIVAPLVAFILISVNTFAHFGSKGPFGGTVTCTAQGTILGNVSNQVFFGTAEGGVYVNNAAVTSWSARPVGLKSGKISALAVTGSYVFAATADSGIFRFTGFVGTDRYWEKVNSGLGNLKITSLVSIDTITLLAGTDNGTIYKTVNKGATWTAISGLPFGSSKITGLVKAGTRIIAIAETKGVYASDNDGSSWSSLNDVNTADIAGTRSLSYNIITDELLVVNSVGVYVLAAASTTNSATYTLSTTGLGSAVVRYISNNGTNWFLATNGGVYKSATGSISWATANTGLSGGTLDVNIVTPFSTNLFVGTFKKGIYKSAIASISFTENNTSFNNVVTYSIATSGDQIIVAANENGVFTSVNLATSYTRANFGLTDSLNVTDLTFLGSKLFATTKNNGVFVSSNLGQLWTAFNTGISNLNVTKIVATTNYVYIFDSNNAVFQSNGTSAWTAFQTGISNGAVLTSLVGYKSSVLLGTTTGVYTSLESSAAWTAINTGLTNTNVTSVTAFGSKIFAGTNGSGVFVSDNSTINWVAASPVSIAHTVTMGVDGTKIQAMGTFGSYVFASYKGGLLATTDFGVTWVAGGNQFNLPSYADIKKIAFVTTRVFVTTQNNSLYSNALSELALHTGISKVENSKCHGVNNGSISIESTGGTAPYTYLWSNAATTSSISGLAAGKYVVTVSDAASHISKDSVVIIEPVKLAVTFTTVPSSGVNGSATANVIGGTTPYSYVWNNDATTQTVSSLADGILSVLVTDANGCSISGGVQITSTAGLNELTNSKFNILPNPTKGEFVVSLDANSTVSSIAIYNGVGKLMNEVNVDKTVVSVPMNVNYPSGVYFVKLNSENGISIQKLIIE